MKKAVALLSCLALGGAVALAALPACDTGTATDEAVITSVTVRASDVTRGLGCSDRAGEVYKYVVFVHPLSGDTRGGVVEAKTVDCFADATFIDPPIVRDTPYALDVYLFERGSFDDEALNAFIADTRRAAEIPAPPGAFGKLTCTVTALFQVQAFASCGEASALQVPARPDASTSDSAVDGGDASDASTDAPTTDGGGDASDASDD